MHLQQQVLRRPYPQQLVVQRFLGSTLEVPGNVSFAATSSQCCIDRLSWHPFCGNTRSDAAQEANCVHTIGLTGKAN
jgi:hypothetical protein